MLFMKVDNVDFRILEMLKQNSRESNVKIAKTVKLTEGAVHHRIENLIRNGSIKKFTVELSSDHEVFAIVMIKSKTESKKMMSELMALKLAKEAYEIAGEYDGCVIISGSSVEDIDEKIDKIRMSEHVADTKTFISLHHW